MRIALSEDWYPFKSDRIFAILCPFHSENTASCMIDPKRATFHCIGCGAKGYIGFDDELFTEEP